MKQNCNSSITMYKESEVFIAGIWSDVGFKQKAIKVNKKSHSSSTYTLRKKVSIVVTSITSFSNKPLIYIFYIGFIITSISSLFILKLLINKIFYDLAFEGWTSLIVSIWFFGGLTILLLGIIGIYLSKIFLEVKARPTTIIKKIYNKINNE